MSQLFFNIDEIPKFINFNYSNKLNIKTAQEYLNKGLTVTETAAQMNVSAHRIYDSIYNNKLYYPSGYAINCYTPIIQMDLWGNIIGEYAKIQDAADKNNIPSSNISQALQKGRNYSSGYLWFYKKDFNDTSYKKAQTAQLKFITPVNKYSINGEFIQSFNTVCDAAKDLGVNNYNIYRVAIGERKSIKGFTYKFSNK